MVLSASDHFATLVESSSPNDLDNGSKQPDDTVVLIGPAARRINMYLSMLKAYVADAASLRSSSWADESFISDYGSESLLPSSSKGCIVTDNAKTSTSTVETASNYFAGPIESSSPPPNNLNNGSKLKIDCYIEWWLSAHVVSASSLQSLATVLELPSAASRSSSLSLLIDDHGPVTDDEGGLPYKCGSYIFPFLEIESPPPSSSEEQGVTDNNAETNTNVQSVSDDGSTNQSENSSLNHNVEYGSFKNPNNKSMHIIQSPAYYLLPSLGPSYGVVNDTASDQDCETD